MRTVQAPRDHQEHINHPLRFFAFTLIVLILAMLIMASSQLSPRPVDGKEVFDRVCTTCHQIDPPAAMMAKMQSADSDSMSAETAADKPIAPPMKMIASRYLAAHETEAEAAASIRSWLEGPSEEKSLMPAMAIAEHGLMPPVNLTEEERNAVASYVLTLGSSDMQSMMQGMMNGKHGGMKGMKPDSTKGNMKGMGKMKHNN